VYVTPADGTGQREEEPETGYHNWIGTPPSTLLDDPPLSTPPLRIGNRKPGTAPYKLDSGIEEKRAQFALKEGGFF
jgi:hypothetical protein